MVNENITTRQDKGQLNRLLKVLLYWGVSNNTEVIRVALNHLENAMQGQLYVSLMDAVSHIKGNNQKIRELRRAMLELKRNAN